ncbi:MAG: hypothetical protein ACJ73C_09920, partial [Nitrososphaeraceae archaeon]
YKRSIFICQYHTIGHGRYLSLLFILPYLRESNITKNGYYEKLTTNYNLNSNLRFQTLRNLQHKKPSRKS